MKSMQLIPGCRIYTIHSKVPGHARADTLCDIQSKWLWPFHLSFAVIVAFCIVVSSRNIFAQSSSDSTKHWVGTWGCAPYAAESNTPPSPGLSNNTLRQVVRVSIGGDTLRVKFSNITCSKAVTINSVNIAESKGGSTIDPSTIKELKFEDNAKLTIDAKSSVTSDPIGYDLKPSMRLAITIYYGQCESSSDMTFHYGSRTDSYILTGDQTSSTDFNNATVVERWYTISTIDVWAPKTATTVAVLGNSITDGYGLHGGLKNRWTDIFSEELLENEATQDVGVLNMGIGATNVASGANSGVSRYQQDVLDQYGLHWVIIFYGVNDIDGGASANTIINAYQNMITDVHDKDTSIKVYGATITPFNGHDYFTPDHELVRGEVNKWIRTDGNFDGIIDFDKAIRDPNDTTRMKSELQNDWLHPNVEGHKALGESVDPELFTLPPVEIKKTEGVSGYAVKEISVSFVNGNAAVVFELPDESFVSLKVYSILGKEIAELAGKEFSSGRHTITVKTRKLVKGIYVYSLTADKRSVSRKMIVSGY